MHLLLIVDHLGAAVGGLPDLAEQRGRHGTRRRFNKARGTLAHSLDARVQIRFLRRQENDLNRRILSTQSLQQSDGGMLGGGLIRLARFQRHQDHRVRSQPVPIVPDRLEIDRINNITVVAEKLLDQPRSSAVRINDAEAQFYVLMCFQTSLSLHSSPRSISSHSNRTR